MEHMTECLAEIVLLVHFLFILFVVFGEVLILIGALLRWSWIKNRTFRLIHLAAILFVAVQAWLGRACPLTLIEITLRTDQEHAIYEGSFVAYWLNKLIYHDCPEWLFVVVYTVFAGIVLGSWILIRPIRKSRT